MARAPDNAAISFVAPDSPKPRALDPNSERSRPFRSDVATSRTRWFRRTRRHRCRWVGTAATGQRHGGPSGRPKRGIYLGIGQGGWAWAGPERSTLVLGPSRSGKTSAIVIPNVLAAPGAVVSTSTKPDVLRLTGPARTDTGWAMLFDPSGSIEPLDGVVRIGWSPLNAARDWDGALSMADAMVHANRRGNRGARASSDDHWTERATSLLAPILHGAALERLPCAMCSRGSTDTTARRHCER